VGLVADIDSPHHDERDSPFYLGARGDRRLVRKGELTFGSLSEEREERGGGACQAYLLLDTVVVG
jgi:hypothetical protein